MEFVLREQHRNVGREEMVADLIRVAKELNTTSLTKKQYQRAGKYSPDTIARKFGGWSVALEESGLIALKISVKPRYKGVSPDALITDIQSVARKLNVETLTSSEYDLHGQYNHNSIIRIFNSWDNALHTAGLNGTGFHRNISETELMENIERMWIHLGRQPTCNDIKSGLSAYGVKVYFKRYGSWSNALKRFIEWTNDDYDDALQKETTCAVKDVSTVVDKPIHNTKREINLRLRFNVMRRDNFKCCICGATPATNPTIELHIDHIVPWAKGGETTLENLQTLCSKCNLGKSDILL